MGYREDDAVHIRLGLWGGAKMRGRRGRMLLSRASERAILRRNRENGKGRSSWASSYKWRRCSRHGITDSISFKSTAVYESPTIVVVVMQYLVSDLSRRGPWR